MTLPLSRRRAILHIAASVAVMVGLPIDETSVLATPTPPSTKLGNERLTLHVYGGARQHDRTLLASRVVDVVGRLDSEDEFTYRASHEIAIVIENVSAAFWVTDVTVSIPRELQWLTTRREITLPVRPLRIAAGDSVTVKIGPHLIKVE